GLAQDFTRFRDEQARFLRKEVSSLHRSEKRTQLKNSELDGAQALITALQAAFAPMGSLSSARPHDLAEIAARHREVLIALSEDADGVAVAFEGEAGLALASAFDELLTDRKQSGLSAALPDYPQVCQTAFADRAVRR